MTYELFAKMRDLSRARINLTGHVIDVINISIIESELKLPLKNASVNSPKLYTALSLKNWLVLLSDQSGTQLLPAERDYSKYNAEGNGV